MDKSFVIFRCGLIITIGLIMLIASVALNIIIIQEIHTHADVMGWSILIIIDFIAFLFFMCIVRGAKGLVIVIVLLTLLAVVVLNIAIIQDMNIRNRVMGYLTLIIIDFLFFMCSKEAVKLMISLILSYDEDRVFASAREEMVAEQKSKMRRIAKIIRVLRY